MQAGERFPFIASHAKGFGPESISKEEKFTSSMEGVACIERYAYEVAKKLSGEDIQGVYSAGGGNLNPTWLKIRSNVMKLPVYKMQTVSGAFGAAVLAASQTFSDGLTDAGNHLIQLEKEIFPDEKLSQTYDSHYRSFIEILKEKNYINEKN
jgi:sugar (pentulose or hexulose) kinase